MGNDEFTKPGISQSNKQRKHKFWDTQPIRKYGEAPSEKPVIKNQDKIYPQKPLKLPEGYTWKNLDLMDKKIMEEVYLLLKYHYVGTEDSTIRFAYTPECLRWAMCPEGCFAKDMHFGIMKNEKLVGFVSGIFQTLRIGELKIRVTDVNFLCISTKERNKRLAPLLICEINRRSNVNHKIVVGFFTCGEVIPTPFGKGCYYHRPLNVAKLIDIDFMHVREGTDRDFKKEAIEQYSLDENNLTLKGLRLLQPKDIPSAMKLVNGYLKKFYFRIIFNNEKEFAHWFSPQKGVINTYVLTNEKGDVTDLTSYFVIDSTVEANIEENKYMKGAYMWYTANSTAKLDDLIGDCIKFSKKNGCDVFNMLNTMEHGKTIGTLGFRKGGYLYYNLFNCISPLLNSNEIALTMI